MRTVAVKVKTEELLQHSLKISWWLIAPFIDSFHLDNQLHYSSFIAKVKKIQTKQPSRCQGREDAASEKPFRLLPSVFCYWTVGISSFNLVFNCIIKPTFKVTRLPSYTVKTATTATTTTIWLLEFFKFLLSLLSDYQLQSCLHVSRLDYAVEYRLASGRQIGWLDGFIAVDVQLMQVRFMYIGLGHVPGLSTRLSKFLCPHYLNWKQLKSSSH